MEKENIKINLDNENENLESIDSDKINPYTLLNTFQENKDLKVNYFF